VCLPLKHASDRRNDTAAQNPGPQDMMRAYTALGLNYPNLAPGNPVAPEAPGAPGANVCPPIPPNQSHGTALGVAQSKRDLMTGLIPNVTGGIGTSSMVGNNPVGQMVAGMPGPLDRNGHAGFPGDLGPMSTTAQSTAPTKEWDQYVTQDLRNHLVHHLVQAIFPTPDPVALKDRRMGNIVAYARKVEGDYYALSNSREEYFHLLAEKVYKIQKELQDKQKARKNQALQQSGLQPGVVGTGVAGQHGQSQPGGTNAAGLQHNMPNEL